MLLFHGTRKTYDKFNAAYFGTGEGGVRVGFYFTDNLKGAYNHSKIAPRPGNSLVYVCRIQTPAIVLNPQKPISKQHPETQDQWEKLPAAYYWAKDYPDWYSNLFRTLPLDNQPRSKDDTATYWFLRKHGIQVLYDTEGSMTDPYLCGPSIVVLDESIIDIIEVLPADKLVKETMGNAKKYELADTQQELGETGLMSFLRQIQM